MYSPHENEAGDHNTLVLLTQSRVNVFLHVMSVILFVLFNPE